MATTVVKNQSGELIERQVRFQSHALVEVKKYKWLPLGTHSAVLLDLSTTGFKLEYTGEVIAKKNEKYWLNIPLSPLGIAHPDRLLCKAECKWFDEGKYRMGGVFIDLANADRIIMEQVVEVLQKRGSSGL